MPDADDFDIEELRALLRGTGGQQQTKAPDAVSRPPAPRKAPKAQGRAAKAGKAAPKAKARPGKGSTKK